MKHSRRPTSRARQIRTLRRNIRYNAMRARRTARLIESHTLQWLTGTEKGQDAWETLEEEAINVFLLEADLKRLRAGKPVPLPTCESRNIPRIKPMR